MNNTLNECIGLGDWLARQVRYYTGWVAVTGQRTLQSSRYLRGNVGYFCGTRSLRIRDVTNVDRIRVDVVDGEHLCYVEYVKYCNSSDKITATVNVMNDACFHVQCKETNVNATFRTLNFHKSKPASVLHYGFTMTRRVPSNSLVYGLIYSIKQFLFITDSVKVFTHDSLVTPISNTFSSNVKRLAWCRFTPGFCPKQPKSKSPLNFTLCTLQSHFPGGKIRACKCRLRVKDSPLTLKAVCWKA